MDVSTSFDDFSEPQVLSVGAILRPITLADEAPWLGSLVAITESPTGLLAPAPASSLVIAQQFDQDILGDMGNLWNTFIESGQVWALLIGIVVGYLIRNLTAY
jgi:hypothetical protein